MIIKGLKAIDAHLGYEGQFDEVSYEGWKREVEAQAHRIDIDGAHHFHLTSDEEGEWILIHIDPDYKFVAVAGVDCSPYKAWRDIPYYCKTNGYDEEEMMRSHSDFIDRYNAAWREQFPEEAAEYDKRQAEYKARVEAVKNDPLADDSEW